jgi:hypothetical protein
MPLPDGDEATARDRADGIAHNASAHPEEGAELSLRWEPIARAETSGDNLPLEPGSYVVAQRAFRTIDKT